MAFSPLVLHIDMDSFFVSVEQRRDARLKNRPLLIGGHSARTVASQPVSINCVDSGLALV
jgi:nucleotidyltransferase/DNA polymerase involved in DNA repair